MAARRRERRSGGYGEFNFQTDYSLNAAEAEQILKDEGVELKEDGSNSEQGAQRSPRRRFVHWAERRTTGNAAEPGATRHCWPASTAHQCLWTRRPQLDPAAEARILPTFFGSQNDEMFIAIGIAEEPGRPVVATPCLVVHKDPGANHANRARSLAGVATSSRRCRWTSSGAGSWPRQQ